ncbi:MAG: hypothetical protein P9M00_10545 [Candidatus Tritonobacter lacicola]|nr:hypothetical protein [Candidatus Tritonobacter lacicola]
MTRSERSSYIFGRIGQTLINAIPLAFLGFAGFWWLLKPETDSVALRAIVGGALAGLALSAFLTYLNSRHIIKKLEEEYAKGNSDAVTA